MSYNDPWDWTQQSQASAPLSGATIQPSQATPAQVTAPTQPGLATQATQMVEGRMINKGLDAATGKGGLSSLLGGTPKTAEAIANTPVVNAVPTVVNTAGPLASVGGQVAADGSLIQGAGVLAPALETAAAVAPAAEVATGALASAAPLAAGAGAAAEGGMMAALASNPIGWAIGAGLLAKQLKIF